MLRFPMIAAVLLGALPLSAQSLDVPLRIPAGDGQAAICASSYVAGLDPNGDGFLAVRRGPGTEFAKIDEVHNGDVLFTCDARGPWTGVIYTGSNANRGYQAEHQERRGWVHSNWLVALAG